MRVQYLSPRAVRGRNVFRVWPKRSTLRSIHSSQAPSFRQLSPQNAGRVGEAAGRLVWPGGISSGQPLASQDPRDRERVMARIQQGNPNVWRATQGYSRGGRLCKARQCRVRDHEHQRRQNAGRDGGRQQEALAAVSRSAADGRRRSRGDIDAGLAGPRHSSEGRAPGSPPADQRPTEGEPGPRGGEGDSYDTRRRAQGQRALLTPRFLLRRQGRRCSAHSFRSSASAERATAQDRSVLRATLQARGGLRRARQRGRPAGLRHAPTGLHAAGALARDRAGQAAQRRLAGGVRLHPQGRLLRAHGGIDHVRARRPRGTISPV